MVKKAPKKPAKKREPKGGKIGRPPKYPRPDHCPHVGRKEHARGVCYQCSKNLSNRLYKKKKREGRLAAKLQEKEKFEAIRQAADECMGDPQDDSGYTPIRHDGAAILALDAGMSGAASVTGRSGNGVAAGGGLDLNAGMSHLTTLAYSDDVVARGDLVPMPTMLPPPDEPAMCTAELDLPMERGKKKMDLSPSAFLSLSSQLQLQLDPKQYTEKDGTHYWYLPVNNSNNHVRIAGSTPNFSASIEGIMNDIAKRAEEDGETDGAGSSGSADMDKNLLSQLAIIFGPS